MSNTAALRGVLIGLLAIGLLLLATGIQLRYYVRTGPGPGFFPVWIGILLSISCLWALVGSFVHAHDVTPFLPSREAGVRVGLVLLGLLATWLLLEYLGFRLAILLFALFVPRVLGRQSMLTVVGVAILASFGIGYVFETWLGVYLPRSSFEALSILGL